jgi:hypothetical protein
MRASRSAKVGAIILPVGMALRPAKLHEKLDA